MKTIKFSLYAKHMELHMLNEFSDLSESRGFEQFLRRACGVQRERSQKQHPTVDFITHLSIKSTDDQSEKNKIPMQTGKPCAIR